MNGFNAAVYMVITEQMEHRMSGQIADLALKGMTVKLSLLNSLRHRDHDVA